MQIGIRLHDTYDLPLEERLRIVKDQGFCCAHVALYKVLKDYTVTPGILTPGLAMYLKKLFQNYNIDIAVLGCYLNLANPDAVQLERTIDSYLAHIRFASLLGCGVLGTETGAPNTSYSYEPACHGEEALQTLIQNLGRVVTYAEKMGVIIAIEPVRSHIVYTPKIARRVLDEINSPNLQIIFDPVNLLEMDNYKQQEQVIREAIDLLGDDIAVIHMKDYLVQEGKMVSVAAGMGDMDYTPVIDFIKKRKPMIQCTLEDTTPKNAVAAREFIQNLWESSNFAVFTEGQSF